MSSPVKVSVIVTAHNYGRFLGRCLDSVLAQTAGDWEVLVMNDGSTDDSPAVLARYARDPRISVHTLTGVGLAAAANQGIRHARGAYVLRLDADDYLDPHAVEFLSSFLDRHDDVALVYPDHFTVTEEGQWLGYTRALDFPAGARGVGRQPLPGGAMARKVCVEAVGGFTETLRYQEDYDFWLRFTASYKVAALHLPLFSYRQHAGSMSRNVVSRAAARRHVKHSHVAATGNRPYPAVIVIPGQWPGEPARSPDRLLAPLGDSTLLDETLRLVAPNERNGRVLAVDGGGKLAAAARARGLRVTAWPAGGPSVPGWPAPLQFLQQVLLQAEGLPPWEVALLLSPYCPFRHAERLQEARDTLVLHQCDLVVSIEADPVQAWVEGGDGLERLAVEAPGAGGQRIVKEAGELWVVRREVLVENRPLAACRIGYVELLGPEAWTVKDELSAAVCEGLRAAAIADKLKPGSFLRSERSGER